MTFKTEILLPGRNYGNYKNRMAFPKLDKNPVRYFGNNLKCSVCERQLTYETTNQMWIAAYVGTDTIPMLANLCSDECEKNLPKPPENYVQFPHKGGTNLAHPLDEDELWKLEMKELERADKEDGEEPQEETNSESKNEDPDISKLPLLKLVRKIWEK